MRRLVQQLRGDLEQRDPGQRCEILETHISIVLLAGDFAYKFKKPVNFGFLDFSTLDRRHRFCEREVALNRRTAPDLYCDVVPLTLRDGRASFDPRGVAAEYAVRMRRFPDGARLDQQVERHAVGVDDFRSIADAVAAFHQDAEPAPAYTPFGGAALVSAQVLGVFEPLREIAGMEALEMQTAQRLARSAADITGRKESGFVRQCHGDLHLSNIVSLDAQHVPFDCIEFSDELSWIDTCSDIAFLIMDLDARGEHALANAFLNRYLETSGDYGAVALLGLYLTYRTLVRAEVAQLALPEEGRAAAERRDRHLELAAHYLAPAGTPAMIITHGLSGSGKSRISEALAIRNGFLHVRSDVERRRLAGLAPGARSGSGLGDGIYSSNHTLATYARLRELAESIIRAGYTVVIDATFLQEEQRRPFHDLAQALRVPFRIIDCRAPEPVLRERITARMRAATDPSEATSDVLDHQTGRLEPLTAVESEVAVEVDDTAGDALISGGRLDRLGRPRV